MLIEALTLVAGIILIVALAKLVLQRSLSLAYHFGLSGSFVGLTVLSIGTSIPEIMNHIIGSVQIVKDVSLLPTYSSLLVGASTGSDIFQQTVVLSLVAIFGIIVVKKKDVFYEVGALIGGALLVLLVSLGGLINRLEGLLLVVTYLGYLWYLERREVKNHHKAHNTLSKKEIALAVFLLCLAFFFMAIVTKKILAASEVLIASLPISASFFGVLILGVASALPELTTALLAIFRGEKEVSIGILIGSNITNPLFGIGLGALISTYSVPFVVTFFDLPVKILTGLLLYYFLMSTGKIGKKRAVVLLSLFVVYLVARNILFPLDVLG